jgi:hypothetical protein
MVGSFCKVWKEGQSRITYLTIPIVSPKNLCECFDAFHLLNWDASFLSVILNPLSNPLMNCCRWKIQQEGILFPLRQEVSFSRFLLIHFKKYVLISRHLSSPLDHLSPSISLPPSCRISPFWGPFHRLRYELLEDHFFEDRLYGRCKERSHELLIGNGGCDFVSI